DIAPDGVAPERQDYRQVVLFDRLLNALQALNPQIPAEALTQVAHQLAKPETPVLIKNNRLFHRHLLEGVKVEYKQQGEDKVAHAQLVDFLRPEKNRFVVVNQLTVLGT